MAVNKKTSRNNIGFKNVKNPDNAPQAVVIQNVEVRPINRTSQDIPKWRRAIQSAEAQMPRRKLLMELYHDVVLDAHVLAVTGKRQDAVTSANWQFVNKDGEAVDEINDLIDSIGFEDLCREILNSKFWGYTICEPKFYKGKDENWEMSACLIPRRHYYPETGIVSYDGVSEDGVNIREGVYAKTVLEAGETTDLGLFASAAQYYVLKRGGIGDYAMYVQVFGRPIIDATWDGVDEEQRQKLRASLNIGAGGVIVRPDGTNLEIKESKGTQSTVHNDFYKAMNDEISKALLGTTETTTSSDSSGYAQAETHATSDDRKFKGDVTFVRKILNSRFIKILEAYGFDTQGGKFIVEETDTTSDKEKITIINDLVEKHDLPIEDEYLYKTFNIPKPDDYDAQKAAQKEASPNPDDGTKSKKKTSPKGNVKEPDKTKDENEDEKEVKLYAKWWKDLKDFFLTAPAQVGATNGKHLTIDLAFESNFNNDAFIKRIYDAEGNLEFDTALFESNLKDLLEGFKKGWDTNFVALNNGLGFEYNFNDPAMLTAFELNLFRFAGAKNLAMVQQLNLLFRQSTSFADFYEKAKQFTKIYNKDYLATEYNTALLTGESAALYHRLIAQTDVFPYWQYVTAGDEHVRHSHKPLHGIVLPANDPRWKKLFPPNGWNCRCYIKPLMKHEFTGDFDKMRAKADTYLNSPAYVKEAAQGWGVNRGEIGEIFTANQQYVNTFQNNSSSILNNLTAVKWGLPQYSNAKKVATTNAPVYDGTADDFYNSLKGELIKELRDYNKRILTIDKKAFDRHTVKKSDNRTILLNAAKETLLQPDEVWYRKEKLNEVIYIKYYTTADGNNKTMVVIGRMKNLQLELGTWFELKEQKRVIEQYRQGLLVMAKK